MADQGFSILGTFEDQITPKASGVAKIFAGFETTFKKLDQLIAPLTGKVTALVAALGGAAVFRESLHAAEEQANAEARLLNALRGRRGALDEIKKSTDALQRTTKIADEQYLDFAATLANVGVAAEDMDDALKAVANTTAALGLAPEQTIRAIAAARRGEVGRIAQLVPELQAIVKEGGNARDVIDELNKRFAGAAEALAATPFGRARVELNLIGEVGEKVGDALIQLKVKALETLRVSLEGLGRALQTPAAQGFLRVIVALVPQMTALAVQIAAVVTAISGLRALNFLLPFLSAAIPLGPALATVAAGIVAVKSGALGAAAGLADFGGAADAAAESIGRTKDEFVDLLAEIAAGKLPVSAFFERIKLQFENTVTFVKALFVEEFKALIRAVPDIASSLLDVLIALFAKLGLAIRQAIENGVNAAIQAVRQKFPNVADFFGIGDERVQLVSQEDIDQTKAALETAFSDLGNTLAGASAQARANLGPALDEIALRNAAFEESLDKQRKQIAANTDEFHKQASAIQRNIGLIEGDIEANLAIAQQAREGTLAKEGTLEQLQAELRLQEQIAGENRAQVEALIAKRADLAEQESQQALTLDLLNQQQEVEGQLLEASKALAESEKNRAATLGEINELRADEAQKLVDATKAARDKLNSDLQAIQAQRTAGAITQGQALDSAATATAAFKEQLDQAKTSLELLLATLPPEKAQELRTSLEGLGAGLDEDKATGFFTGVVQGAEKATVALDDMGQVGVQVGEELAESLASGLAEVFVKGQKSLREFLGEFLQAIALMITKLLILKAIQATLGGLGSVVAGIGANRGGLILGFDSGGSVPGPSVNRDVVPAVLTPGEFVQTRDATQYYGVGVMEAMRRMVIPREAFAGVPAVAGRTSVKRRFASGGAVSQSLSTPVSDGATFAQIVANEQNLDRLIAGGEAAFTRALERNADTINGLRRGSVGGG